MSKARIMTEPDRVEGRVAEWVDHKRVVVAPAAAAASL